MEQEELSLLSDCKDYTGFSNVRCLICCGTFNGSDNNSQTDSALFSSGKENVFFLIRLLLDIPKEDVDDKQLLQKAENEQGISICEECSLSVNQAKQAYHQLLEVLYKFKDIQRRVVDKLRKRKQAPGIYEAEGKLDKTCRNFVDKHDYNDKLEKPEVILDLKHILPEPEVDVKEEIEEPDADAQEDNQFSFNSDSAEEVRRTLEQQDTIPVKEEPEDSDNSEHGSVPPSPPKPKGRGRPRKQRLDSKPQQKQCRNLRPNKDDMTPTNPIGYPCPVQTCKKLVVSFPNLKVHCKNIHNLEQISRPNFPCSKNGCFHIFRAPSHLISHLKKHDMGVPMLAKPEECPFCHQFYLDTANLRHHLRSQHPSEKIYIPPKTYPCTFPNCGKAYSRRTTLAEHVTVHGTEGKYKCNICGASYHQRNGFVRHQEREHGQGGSKICEICGHHARTNSALYLHRRNQHKVATKKYLRSAAELDDKVPEVDKVNVPAGNTPSAEEMTKDKDHDRRWCSICSKLFSCVTTLQRHLIVKHGTGGDMSQVRGQYKPDFQCPVKGCRKGFWGQDKQQVLEQHVREAHGEDGKKMPYICRFCGKGFGTVSKLRIHEMIHENKGTKPFRCEICGKSFATPKYLRYHEFGVHKVAPKFVRKKRIHRKKPGDDDARPAGEEQESIE